jgi:hypothetical protein
VTSHTWPVKIDNSLEYMGHKRGAVVHRLQKRYYELAEKPQQRNFEGNMKMSAVITL